MSIRRGGFQTRPVLFKMRIAGFMAAIGHFKKDAVSWHIMHCMVGFCRVASPSAIERPHNQWRAHLDP